MNSSARWTLALAVVMVVVLGAFVAEFVRSDDGAPTTSQSADGPQEQDRRAADTAEALAGPRQRADLRPCPGPGDGPGPEKLRGIELECASDGSTVDVAEAVAGRPTVLNLWAYWCGPCADELPAMAEYQRRVGSAVTVLTVHQDQNEEAALLRLAELGVHLPTLQDGRRRVAGALRVPNVMPATVVLRADGSVAQILPRSFATAEEIEAAVGDLR
ncbi:TlpA disulfide reductase family protein [Mycobacterium sp. ACS4331]|uniref:TlpA family protein disulfide reductase n=1 Tax=Mycobacterium sp. ACS4331 TaxID=1834121 RepID=UPI0007FBF072|nr:TlpA disulfide reductase family protein [Mycobacterium sp. ACS4331]OBF23321.1 hypothetical protein A5727_06925 [Mycobacterium sp. ACS4331]